VTVDRFRGEDGRLDITCTPPDQALELGFRGLIYKLPQAGSRLAGLLPHIGEGKLRTQVRGGRRGDRFIMQWGSGGGI